MGAHSLEKLGAKMGANSFYYQRVRAERNSKNLGALNTLAYILVKINTSGFLNRQADLAVFPTQGDVSACLTAVEGHDITSTQLFDYCITT